MATIDELVTFAPKRALGPITALVTIEESHTDELTITDHPVEQGAAITDHAYKRPAEVTIRCAWSNSSTEADGDEGYVNIVYQALLDLQESREPFDVFTGKRVYSNMLFLSLGVTTDETSENALQLRARCREIIIVQTQATTLPPVEKQATPRKTAETSNAGVKTLVPATPAPGGSGRTGGASGDW